MVDVSDRNPFFLYSVCVLQFMYKYFYYCTLYVLLSCRQIDFIAFDGFILL